MNKCERNTEQALWRGSICTSMHELMYACVRGITHIFFNAVCVFECVQKIAGVGECVTMTLLLGSFHGLLRL